MKKTNYKLTEKDRKEMKKRKQSELIEEKPKKRIFPIVDFPNCGRCKAKIKDNAWTFYHEIPYHVRCYYKVLQDNFNKVPKILESEY